MILLAGLLTGTTAPLIAADADQNWARASVAELAAGYAAAAKTMNPGRLVVFYRTESNRVEALTDVQSVRAIGGVIIVALFNGGSIAVSAEKIVMVTDTTRTP